MKNLKYMLFLVMISFLGIISVSAKTCSYSINGYKTSTKLSVISTNNNVSASIVDTTGSFNTSGKINVKNPDVVGKNTIYGTYSKTVVNGSNLITVSDLYSNSSSCSNNCLTFTLESCTENENDSTGSTGAGREDNFGTTGSNTGTGSDTDSGDISDSEWTGEAFCQREGVKKTFRAIGWVILIIKILVPVLLIVFGSIDFAKAVIASKDDEIKKSARSLGIRVIIGVLIFFIPTIINFAVKIIGGEDIYNENSGSFGFCTHCMLEPTDSDCGGD